MLQHDVVGRYQGWCLYYTSILHSRSRSYTSTPVLSPTTRYNMAEYELLGIALASVLEENERSNYNMKNLENLKLAARFCSTYYKLQYDTCLTLPVVSKQA